MSIFSKNIQNLLLNSIRVFNDKQSELTSLLPSKEDTINNSTEEQNKLYLKKVVNEIFDRNIFSKSTWQYADFESLANLIRIWTKENWELSEEEKKKKYLNTLIASIKLLEEDFINWWIVWDDNFWEFQRTISILGYFRNIVWEDRFGEISYSGKNISEIFDKAVKRSKAIDSFLDFYLTVKKLKNPIIFQENSTLTPEDIGIFSTYPEMILTFKKNKHIIWSLTGDYLKEYLGLYAFEESLTWFIRKRLKIIEEYTNLEKADEKILLLGKLLELVKEPEILNHAVRINEKIRAWHYYVYLFNNTLDYLKNMLESNSDSLPEKEISWNQRLNIYNEIFDMGY